MAVKISKADIETIAVSRIEVKRRFKVFAPMGVALIWIPIAGLLDLSTAPTLIIGIPSLILAYIYTVLKYGKMLRTEKDALIADWENGGVEKDTTSTED